MRLKVRALAGRLRTHCEQIGIAPPDIALRRYATLRYIESCWWLRDKMTADRQEVLDDLAERLRLDAPTRDTPICSPDLADSVWQRVSPASYAPWADNALMVSMRDLT